MTSTAANICKSYQIIVPAISAFQIQATDLVQGPSRLPVALLKLDFDTHPLALLQLPRPLQEESLRYDQSAYEVNDHIDNLGRKQDLKFI